VLSLKQEIAEVFPHASSIQREKNPNIYESRIRVELTLPDKSAALLEKGSSIDPFNSKYFKSQYELTTSPLVQAYTGG
jgi:hypothetical protein